MFDAAGIARIERSVMRVARYFEYDDFALTGGVAVEWHLARAGLRGMRTTLADVDCVARHVEGSRHGIAGDFLISHYHAAGPGAPKALLQLVDPVEHLRIDIFPDRDGALADAVPAAVGAAPVRMLSAARILAHKAASLRKATAAQPVDPKHWDDAEALARVTASVRPERPLYVARAALSTDLDAACERCERSRRQHLPLAPKTQIFALLGYV